MELNSSHLIQRLNKPNGINKNAFGAGLELGGFSEKSFVLFSEIFSFDYMGAAEFEYGAVPKCFESIAKNGHNYILCSLLEINNSKIYIICKKTHILSIIKRVKEIALNKVVCLEITRFDTAVGLNKNIKKENCNTIGWVDILNEFIFFTDEKAAIKTAELFLVKYEICKK
jgi:hypothetical protein